TPPPSRTRCPGRFGSTWTKPAGSPARTGQAGQSGTPTTRPAFAAWPAPDAAATDAQGPRHYAGTMLRWAGRTAYAHDAQGRVTLKQRAGEAGAWHYRWDADDRLAEVSTPHGQHWRYRYDALGRRIAKQRMQSGVVAEQLDLAWDGPVLAEQAGAGH